MTLFYLLSVAACRWLLPFAGCWTTAFLAEDNQPGCSAICQEKKK